MTRLLVALAWCLALFASARGARADDALEEPLPKQAHLAVRASGGAAFRRLYDIDVGVGFLELGVGADTKVGSFTGGLFGAFGETEEGLGTRHLGLQGQAAWTVADRLRFGVGPRVGWVVLDKLTSDDASKSLTVGVAGELGVDVVRSAGLAVEIGLAPEIHALVGGDFDVWGSEHEVTALPSLGLFIQVRQRFARSAAAPPAGPPSP